MNKYIAVIILALNMSCSSSPSSSQNTADSLSANLSSAQPDFSGVSDTSFVRMQDYAEGFGYDMKYATADNFLQKAVYPCAQCMLRKEVADALIKANESLQSQGLKIKFYDCYRPLSVQKAMWAIYPNAEYVADPASGSIHNRGGAVDITLTDLAGKELDMGTPFDHFGVEAHHSYEDLSDAVKANRTLLKTTMESVGFSAIASEWWHYNFEKASEYPISDFTFQCE